MDCNIILDLIPLYIDECCSEQSAVIVKEHINTCEECRAVYESMNTSSQIEAPVLPAKTPQRVNYWKASVLQSVLLFSSFAAITLGVALEAASPLGLFNGIWAFNLVIPATGFLFSLANWYFVRLYKSRRSFSNCSALATFVATALCSILAGFHYELSIIDFTEFLFNSSIQDFFETTMALSFFFAGGIILTAALCLLSKLLSNKYAATLGKE